MLKEFVYGVIGLAIVALSYFMLSTPAFVIASTFDNLGAPSNVINMSKLAFSLAFIGLAVVILLFLLLRGTRKSYDIREY